MCLKISIKIKVSYLDSMPKDLVRVFSPTIYELEAGSAREAEQEAVERYKQERHT